jgi:hypothetical protein
VRPTSQKLNILSAEECNHLLGELSAWVPAVQFFCRFPYDNIVLGILKDYELQVICKVCPELLINHLKFKVLLHECGGSSVDWKSLLLEKKDLVSSQR